MLVVTEQRKNDFVQKMLLVDGGSATPVTLMISTWKNEEVGHYPGTK